MNDLAASYAYCQRLARQSASNFFFSFLLLPREKRRAMCALYAYMRHVDDLGDDPGRSDSSHDLAARRAALAELRTALSQLNSNHNARSPNPILPALADTIARYHIPLEYLTAVIDGVEMDLAGAQYETFADLEQYCHRVASVVGLACLHIWGFRSSAAIEPARRCGLAFQLTNILRDLREDAAHGRIYLPQEDFCRFHYTPDQLQRSEINDQFLELMNFEIARTEQLYAAAAKLEPLLERDGARVFRAMTATYHRLLEKIQRRPGAVLAGRIRLSKWEKLRIAADAILARPARFSFASTREAVSS